MFAALAESFDESQRGIDCRSRTGTSTPGRENVLRRMHIAVVCGMRGGWGRFLAEAWGMAERWAGITCKVSPVRQYYQRLFAAQHEGAPHKEIAQDLGVAFSTCRGAFHVGGLTP